MTRQIEIEYLTPDSLKPNPWNSNYVSPENEKKLRESIERFGVYKPVICRELPDGRLEILGGEHRARAAADMGIETVPVINLGAVDDKKAKAIGLADNGRYGDDDLLKLSEVLKDIGSDAVLFLPFEEKDLASMFTLSDINLDDLELPGTPGGDEPLPEVKPSVTHQMMTFKVPLADAETITKLVESLVKTRGYDKDQDSKAAAGLALVDICNAGRAHL